MSGLFLPNFLLSFPRFILYLFLCLCSLGLLGCKKGQAQEANPQLNPNFNFARESFQKFLSEYLPQNELQDNSQTDSKLSSSTSPENIRANILAEPQQFLQLVAKLLKQEQQQPYLSFLVDKQHPLPANYSPKDLVDLTAWQKELTAHGREGPSILRAGLKLRRILLDDLQRMSVDAKKQGIRLPIASSYRSYNYQDDVFRRYTKRDGINAANRYSARPGQSQHQLGLAIDFAPISQAFARTDASKWLVKHALDYGFSLSYPQAGEAQTGYIYEPWHYRYVGPITAEILTRYFANYQQGFMLFWHEAKPALQKQYIAE